MKRVLAPLALALVVLCAPVHAGEKSDPIIDAAKKNVSDPTKPFTMVVVLTVKDGKGKELETAFAPAIKATRKEKGCIAYDLNGDKNDATKYYVYERWQSIAALEAHLKTAHIKTLLGTVGDLIAGPPEAKFYSVVGE